MVIRIILYLGAILTANFLVAKFGPAGLLFSSVVLIPFDFVLRCTFHERWRGPKLVAYLGALVGLGSIITYYAGARDIALGSAAGFLGANIAAGLYYQLMLRMEEPSMFIKINGSDFVAICFDSVLFQLIVFSGVSLPVMLGQIIIKLFGGIMWYLFLFKVLKIKI